MANAWFIGLLRQVCLVAYNIRKYTKLWWSDLIIDDTRGKYSTYYVCGP